MAFRKRLSNAAPIGTVPNYLDPSLDDGEERLYENKATTMDIDNLSLNSEVNGKTNSISEVFWYAYSSLMGAQSAELKSLNSVSTKIVVGIWWFFALIVLSSYTANLAAGLTVTRMEAPIKSFEDLANQKKIKYGTLDDTSIYKFITEKGETSIDDKDKYKAMSKMIQRPENQLNNLTEAMHKVRSGSEEFAFLWDIDVIEHVLTKDENCTLLNVGPTIYEKGYGIALRQGSQYRDLFSIGILMLQEQGILENLERKWWPDVRNKCSKQSKDYVLILKKIAPGFFQIFIFFRKKKIPI